MGSRVHSLSLYLSLLIFAFLVGAACRSSSSHSTQMSPGQAPPLPQTPTNVLTYHNDIARTGQNLTETILTHANVNSSSFGKLFSVPLDGKVDAQPLYVSQLNLPMQGVRSVIFATTEHDSVYAIDASNGAVLWHATLLNAGEVPSDDR